MNDGLKKLDELIEKANKVIGKKLSTKERKKLPASSFCGPGKSFPCPDCSHVRAAKSLLGRSKFSDSTKKKILTCINKKAKSLKCFKADEAKASLDDFPKFINLTYEEKQAYRSDVFDETKLLLSISLKNPGADLEDCYGLLLKE